MFTYDFPLLFSFPFLFLPFFLFILCSPSSFFPRQTCVTWLFLFLFDFIFTLYILVQYSNMPCFNPYYTPVSFHFFLSPPPPSWLVSNTTFCSWFFSSLSFPPFSRSPPLCTLVSSWPTFFTHMVSPELPHSWTAATIKHTMMLRPSVFGLYQFSFFYLISSISFWSDANNNPLLIMAIPPKLVQNYYVMFIFFY